MQRSGAIVQLRSFGNDFFTGLLDGHMLGHIGPHALRPGPSYCVANDALNLRMMIDRISLVTGTEIKNPSAAARPAIAAAKNFAALKPRNEDLLVGHRNAERLAIHLGLLQ